MTSLLPPNRTQLESIISETIAAQFPLPVPAIRTVLNPDSCPVELLAFLAWHLSIDLWDERWDEVKKREVCRKALTLHALKTTLAGIKAHVGLVGAEVIKAVRPPATSFFYPAMTDAQRRTWLDGLPQIRLYPFFEYGIARRRFFFRRIRSRLWPQLSFDAEDESWRFDSNGRIFDMAGPDPDRGFRPSYFGHAFARSTRGLQLMGTRATYWDRGEERDIKLDIPAEGVTRLLIPRHADRSWYGQGYLGSGWLKRSQAGLGVVTVRLSADVGGYAVAAGLNPVDVRPERIAQSRTAPDARAFFGRRHETRFMRASWGPRLVYDRVSLHVPDRMGARRRARTFFGHARMGIEPFTAELKIRVPMMRMRSRAGRWFGAGYMRAADMRPLDQAIRAVRVSKAFRDTIRVDTRTRTQVKFSGGLRFGDFTFGEIREAS